jgi:hypothetical protein
VLRFWFLCWAGYVENVRELLPRLLKEGAARGDVNMEVSLRLLSYVHYAYLSVDQPDRCISECREALSRWSRRGYHLQNYGATFSLVECHLYLGEYERARTILATDWDRMSRSFILRWQTLRIMVLFLKGRTALACWLDRRDDAALRREVLDCARKLARIRSHWTKPMADVLRASSPPAISESTRPAASSSKRRKTSERVAVRLCGHRASFRGLLAHQVTAAGC